MKPLVIEKQVENKTEDIQIQALTARIAQLEQQQAFYRALNHFNEIMQWQEQQTIALWCSRLLVKLAPFTEAVQAVMYYLQPTSQQLQLGASYAVADLDTLPKTITPGQGTVGAVAKTQKPQILTKNNHPLTIGSQLTATPAAILLLPLVYQRNTCGVVEMTFLQTPPADVCEFLYKLSESIAGHLNSLVKEEILRQTLGQFRESESRLQRLAEVSTEGILMIIGQRVTEVSPAFMALSGYTADEVLHQSVYKFFPYAGEELLHISDNDIRRLRTQLKHRSQSACYVETQCKEMVAGGNKVRVLSVLDVTARHLAEMQLQESTERLAEAEKIVELSRIIEQKNENITSSLRYARRIQQSLMPRHSLMQQLFTEYFVMYRPRDIVSGDFYWIQQVGTKLMVALGDCTGHGVPAAFMSMLGIATLNNIALQKGFTQADEILDELRKEIYYLLQRNETERQEGMDVSLCVIDKESGIVEFAGARNDLIYIHNDELHHLKGSKTHIGGELSDARFEVHRITLQPKTSLYLFSDGYRDQFGGPKGRKLGSRNFQAWLTEVHNLPMSTQREWLEASFDRWIAEANESQLDDVSLIGIRL